MYRLFSFGPSEQKSIASSRSDLSMDEMLAAAPFKPVTNVVGGKSSSVRVWKWTDVSFDSG